LTREERREFSGMIRNILQHGLTHGAGFGQRIGPIRALLQSGQGGQSQTSQHRYDGDDNKEFD
jgi:hypothetical protein